MDKIRDYKDFDGTKQFRLNYGYFRMLVLAGAFDAMLEQHFNKTLEWKDYEVALGQLAKVMRYKPTAAKIRKSARVSMAEQAASIQGDMGLALYRINNNPVTMAHADMTIVKKTLMSRGAKPCPPGSGYLFSFGDSVILNDIASLKIDSVRNYFKSAGRNRKGPNGWSICPYPAILCMILDYKTKKTKKGKEMMLVSILHGDSIIDGLVAWSMDLSGVMSQKIVQNVKVGAYGLLKFTINDYNGKGGYVLVDFTEIKA